MKTKTEDFIDVGVVWDGTNFDKFRSYLTDGYQVVRGAVKDNLILITNKGNVLIRPGDRIKKRDRSKKLDITHAVKTLD